METKSDPLLGSDILDPQTTAESLVQVNQLIDGFERLGVAMKVVASNSGKVARGALPKDTADLKAQTEAVKESTAAAKSKMEIDKNLIELQVRRASETAKLRQEVKDQIAIDKAATDSLVAMRLQLKELNKEYDNASAANREKLKPAIQELTSELNKQEQASGRYFRVIGNYHDNTIKYAKGLGGLGRLMSRVFGFDSEGFQELQEAGRALKEYHHAQEAASAATEEHSIAEAADTTAVEYNTAATEENIVAEKEQAIAKAASLGWWVLLAAAIVAGAIALYEWTKAVVYDTKAWAENNDALKESLKNRNELREEMKKTAIDLEKSKGYINDKEAQTFNLLIDQEKKKNELTKKGAEEYNKINEEFAEALKKAKINDNKEEIDRIIDEKDKRKAIIRTALNEEFKLYKQNQGGKIDSNEDKKPKSDRDIAFELTQHKLMLLKLETEGKKQQLDIQEQIDLNANEHDEKNLKVREAKRLEIIAQYNKDVLALSVDLEGKLIKVKQAKGKMDDSDQKERLKKIQEEYDLRKKMADEDLAAVSEILKAKSDAQQAALKTDTEMLESEAQVQATLAAAGKRNSLDQTIAAEKKAAQEQKDLARKAAQEQEALALGKLFIDADSAFLKSGSTPSEAFGKALQQVFLAKGVAAGLSNALFDGTADTGGSGGLDSKGGKLAMLHPHEAVIPRKRNEENPGLAKAWIDGNVDQYLQSMYLQKLSVNVDEKRQTDQMITKQMISEAMKEAFKEMPTKTAYKNGNDTVIEEEKGGRKLTRIIKGSEPIIARA